MLRLTGCPRDDQGLVCPLVTATGDVILLCDSGGEAWLDPSAISEAAAINPRQPDWRVTDDVAVVPGTTRWADARDLPHSWRIFTWHDD